MQQIGFAQRTQETYLEAVTERAPYFRQRRPPLLAGVSSKGFEKATVRGWFVRTIAGKSSLPQRFKATDNAAANMR